MGVFNNPFGYGTTERQAMNLLANVVGAVYGHYQLKQGRTKLELEKEKVRYELEEEQRKFETLLDSLPGCFYRCHNDKDWSL